MVDLKDIARLLTKKEFWSKPIYDVDDAAVFDEEQDTPWLDKPEVIKNYDVPEFVIRESSANNAEKFGRRKYSKVLAFIDAIKRRRSKKYCTILPISSKSKTNLMIWGSSRNVSNAIELMKDIGLLREHNASYSRYGKCKTYEYYIENEIKFKEYCSNKDIKRYIGNNTPLYIYTNGKFGFLAEIIDPEDVLFANNINIEKPNGVSVAEFESYLTYCLHINYPRLRYYQTVADYLNHTVYRDYPDFQIRFVPNIKWVKHKVRGKNEYVDVVKSIGIRATNSLCNKKEGSRDAILFYYGLGLGKDIVSSVPRITASINCGSWVDESVDMYRLMFEKMYPDRVFGEDDRKDIKKLFMRAYFDKTDKLFCHHTRISMQENGLDENQVNKLLIKYRSSVLDAVGGKAYGNEIFFIESCMCLDVILSLTKLGLRVWGLYDGFYSTGEGTIEQSQFSSLVNDLVEQAFYKQAQATGDLRGELNLEEASELISMASFVSDDGKQ